MKKIEDKIAKGSSTTGAVWVGIGISCSRISGFIRDIVIAYFFGNSGLADVWRVALKIPNVIQNLLGEGTLSASVIPIYSELIQQKEKDTAGRFIGAILGILMIVSGVAALLGMLVVPRLLASIFVAWDSEKIALAGTLVRILFPMTAILVISAWALAILNSHRRFFLPYCAPVAWNGVIVLAVSVMGFFYELSGEQLLVTAAWGALAGGIVQVVIQLPTVLTLLTHFKLSLGKAVFGVQEAIKSFIPVVMARGVVNISALLEVVLAALLVEGAVAALGYAQTLYLMPISIFGLSVAAAELPELSRKRLAPPDVVKARIEQALENIHFWVMPSMFGFLVFGDTIITGIYQRGEFLITDVPVVYGVLAAYSLGLVASSGSRVLSTGFYALRDTRTPARLAYIRVTLSLFVGFLLMFPLDELQSGNLHYGPVGLALGTSLAAWVEYGMLKDHLKGKLRLDRFEIKGLMRIFGGSCIAAIFTYAVQAVTNLGLSKALPIEEVGGSLGQPIMAVIVVLSFGASYLVVMDSFGVGWSISRWLKNLQQVS